MRKFRLRRAFAFFCLVLRMITRRLILRRQISPGLLILLCFVALFPAVCVQAEELEKGAPVPVWELALDQVGKVFTQEESRGQLEGPLPVGVGQNYFGWQKSRVKSALVEKDGERYFRMEVSDVFSMGPQFVMRIPRLEEGKYYRLSATVRNLSEGRFNLYLRENPDPYANIGAGVSAEADGEWRTYSATICFRKPASDNYSLYFALSGDGIYDLREFSLTETDAAEFDAFQRGMIRGGKIIRPDAGWKNFVFSSCFPFGVPAGWNCRYGKATVSDDVAGPSGQPALKLERGLGEKRTPCLFSAPFLVPEPEKTYSISFSYRSLEPIQCCGRQFDASSEWRRASMPIQISAKQSAAFLEFTSADTFWLDGVRVGEEGETEYRTAGECELALGLPRSDASVSRVQFEDEPAQILWKALGDVSGATLRGSVTNIWGETRSLPEISLEKRASGTDRSGGNESGELSYLIFPETPLGQFRVELQAFRGDRAISPVAEFVVSRFHRPIYWGKDAPNSRFGIHQEPIEYLLTGLKAGGLNWIRLHDGGFIYCQWPAVEAEKGKWTFHDDAIQEYRKRNFMLYGQLGGAPTWASYYANTEFKPDGYWKYFAAPTEEHLGDFENYAYQIVKRYADDIQDWFVWNEPWGGFFHCGYDAQNRRYLTFENQGAAYAKVMAAGYAGAKRANPNVRVTGFGTYGGATTFTKQIVDAGGNAFCDELDYHQYSNKTFCYPGDGNETNLKNTFASLEEASGPIAKPIIMSEGSPFSNGSDRGQLFLGLYRNVLPWENNEKYSHLADDVTRFTASLLNCGLKRVFLYTAHGFRNLTRCSFQMLLAADGYPHPSLAALSQYAWLAEDSEFKGYRELAPNVYAAIYARRDGSSFALVTGKRNARAEITCSAADAKGFDLYGNPLSLPMKYDGFLHYVTSSEKAEALEERIYGKELKLEE